MTSPSAYIRLQIIITSILPPSSRPLRTPSGPHHMLPEVLSLDTGSAPPGPSVSLSPPRMTPGLTVHTSPPASQIYSPCAHLPFWANPSLKVPPFLPLSMEEHPKPTSPWPLPFTLQLECHGLQFHTKVELRLLSEHPEATWYWERVWAPESDGLVSFLISDPWQVLLTSTSFPQR